MRRFLSSGGNLIDTSANYGLGDSELLCGEVLREVDRDSVIVVTKAGYIQGQNKMTAVQQGYPEVVKFAPDVWHCIHPAFLRDQFDLSCARLGVDRIDVYLLHNPEYFLKDAANRGLATGAARAEFYRRMTAAFACLEELVAQGRLSWYGVSSNTFGTPADLPDHVSLCKVLECARSLGDTHHFRVVQLPLNLLETGPATLKVEDGRTVLECARRASLGVLTNRPLNAIVSGQLFRLAEEAPPPPARESAAQALARLAGHEQEFRSQFDFPLLGGGLGATGWLSPLVEHLPSLEEFRTAISQAFTPAANTWLLNADHNLRADHRYAAWRAEFATRLDATILALQQETASGLQLRARAVRRALERAGVPPSTHSLSQLSLAAVLNLPGVSCVLNGMRRPAYVDDSLGALEVDMPNALEVMGKLTPEAIFDSPPGR
jgi:aryl-alcohol dehydrogenase-like predicted oxidoreductase